MLCHIFSWALHPWQLCITFTGLLSVVLTVTKSCFSRCRLLLAFLFALIHLTNHWGRGEGRRKLQRKTVLACSLNAFPHQARLNWSNYSTSWRVSPLIGYLWQRPTPVFWCLAPGGEGTGWAGQVVPQVHHPLLTMHFHQNLDLALAQRELKHRASTCPPVGVCGDRGWPMQPLLQPFP